MSQSVDDEDAQRVMDSLYDTFDIIMSAKQDQFTRLPATYEVEFSGETEAEARGSARHVADVVREEGYSCELEYGGPAEQIEELSGTRYDFTLVVSDDG